MATPPDFSVGQVLTAAHMDAVGLWLIDEQTTGATSSTITLAPDIFTADFMNYLIVIDNLVSTNTGTVTAELMKSATPATTTYSYGGLYRTFAGGSGDLVLNSGANWLIGGAAAATITGGTINIQRPKANSYTTYQVNWANHDAIVIAAGVHKTSDTYDSIRFTINTGNLSGTFRVYGYRN